MVCRKRYMYMYQQYQATYSTRVPRLPWPFQIVYIINTSIDKSYPTIHIPNWIFVFQYYAGQHHYIHVRCKAVGDEDNRIAYTMLNVGQFGRFFLFDILYLHVTLSESVI